MRGSTSIRNNLAEFRTPGGAMHHTAAQPLPLQQATAGRALRVRSTTRTCHGIMKSRTFATQPARMSADAYAGFLALWLTPAKRTSRHAAEVDAYLRHASAQEPLSDTVRRALGQPTHRAA